MNTMSSATFVARSAIRSSERETVKAFTANLEIHLEAGLDGVGDTGRGLLIGDRDRGFAV